MISLKRKDVKLVLSRMIEENHVIHFLFMFSIEYEYGVHDKSRF